MFPKELCYERILVIYSFIIWQIHTNVFDPNDYYKDFVIFIFQFDIGILKYILFLFYTSRFGVSGSWKKYNWHY